MCTFYYHYFCNFYAVNEAFNLKIPQMIATHNILMPIMTYATITRIDITILAFYLLLGFAYHKGSIFTSGLVKTLHQKKENNRCIILPLIMTKIPTSYCMNSHGKFGGSIVVMFLCHERMNQERIQYLALSGKCYAPLSYSTRPPHLQCRIASARLAT